MSNANDFVIENGVLKKYVGPGDEVVIPEGVESIDDMVFGFTSTITSVVIPACVQAIGNSSFVDCSALTRVEIWAKILNFTMKTSRAVKI